MEKSDSNSKDFKELTKKDAENALAAELSKLKQTSELSDSQSQLIDKEFNGFKGLYKKFLDTTGPIVWENIKTLPSDAVKY